MHIVTGGAYNGKSQWVRNFYGSKTKYWLSAYRGDNYPYNLDSLDQDLVVFSGVEQWILEWLEDTPMSAIRPFLQQIVLDWVNWEKELPDRKLVVIGCDVSKGIVPMEKQMRHARDAAGWFYQDLVQECERLDIIWYGIGKQLK